MPQLPVCCLHCHEWHVLVCCSTSWIDTTCLSHMTEHTYIIITVRRNVNTAHYSNITLYWVSSRLHRWGLQWTQSGYIYGNNHYIYHMYVHMYMYKSYIPCIDFLLYLIARSTTMTVAVTATMSIRRPPMTLPTIPPKTSPALDGLGPLEVLPKG